MTSRNALQRGVINMCTTAGMEDWLGPALAAAAACSTEKLLQLYTEASRRVPARQFPAEPDSGASAQWTCVDAARAALLLARAESTPAATFAAEAVECYANGDAGEQRSWLRAVALLPEPQRFLSTVIDACRTNIVPNFEAVACENPYPARHFPELNFNQLVMKAMFNNVRLTRIVGLAGRTNTELNRMAADFAAERRAAGRPVPADIDLALSPTAHTGTLP